MSTAQLDAVLRHIRKLAGAHAPEESDASLLDRFLAHNDEAALAGLVARHGPMVWGVCRRLLADPNDAEDAFQATFLVLVRKAGSIRKAGSVASWLHGVAHRLALRVREGRRRERPLTEEVPAMSAADPLTEAARHELRTLLDEELGRLPEKYRGPVLLCDMQGRSHEEAARQLGYPAGSMSWRLARGRDLLRQRLARRGVALSAGALVAVLVEEASATVPAAVATATVRAAILVTAGAALPAPIAALVDGTAWALAATGTQGYRRLGIGVVLVLTSLLATDTGMGQSTDRGKTPPDVRQSIRPPPQGPRTDHRPDQKVGAVAQADPRQQLLHDEVAPKVIASLESLAGHAQLREAHFDAGRQHAHLLIDWEVKGLKKAVVDIHYDVATADFQFYTDMWNGTMHQKDRDRPIVLARIFGVSWGPQVPQMKDIEEAFHSLTPHG